MRGESIKKKIATGTEGNGGNFYRYNYKTLIPILFYVEI